MGFQSPVRDTWRTIKWAYTCIPRAPHTGKGLSIWLYRFWVERFTAAGRLTVVALLTLVALEMLPGISGAFYPAMALGVAIALSWILTLKAPLLRAQWVFPQEVREGETFQIQIRVQNISNKTILHGGAWLFWEQVFLAPLTEPSTATDFEPGEQKLITVPVKGTWRGPCPVQGPTAFRIDPLGLMRARVKNTHKASFALYPKSLLVLDMPFLTQGHAGQAFARLLLPQVERSMEVVGMRPFRQGDSPRDIHHRAWARVGEPVAKEYSRESGHGVILVLETRTHTFLERSMLEPAIRLAEGVAQWMKDREILHRCFIDNREIPLDQFSEALAHIARPLWWPVYPVEPWQSAEHLTNPVLAIGCTHENLHNKKISKRILVSDVYNKADGDSLLIWNPSGAQSSQGVHL